LSLARPLAMTCYSRAPVSRAISIESPCARNCVGSAQPKKNPNRRKLYSLQFPSEGPHPSSFSRWATHRTLLAAAAARNALKKPIQSSLLQGTHITSAAQSFIFLHEKALVVGAKIFCLRIALILDEPRHLCRRMHRASAVPCPSIAMSHTTRCKPPARLPMRFMLARNKQATPTAIPLENSKQNPISRHKSRLAGHNSSRPSCRAAATMYCDAQTAAFTMA